MFTLSKMNPEIIFSMDSYKSLGEKLKQSGNRVLLICSGARADRAPLEKIKDILSFNSLTFIQYNQSKNNLNNDNLNEIIERARNFSVTSIISLGDFNQIMAGRFIAEEMGIAYFEAPTSFYTPYLFIPSAIYSNRVGDGYENLKIEEYRINSIVVDPLLKKDLEELDYSLQSLSILLDLAQLFLAEDNNLISINESKNLFLRILDSLEKDSGSDTDMYRFGLTSCLYHQISSDIDLNLTLFSWVAGYRFKANPYLFSAKLLPWLLDMYEEEKLGARVRQILVKNNIDGRLTDLGFTLDQLKSVTNHIPTKEVIEKAF